MRRFSQERHDRLIRSIYGDHAPGSGKRWEENRVLHQDVQRREGRDGGSPGSAEGASKHATPYGAGRPKLDPARLPELYLDLAEGKQTSIALGERYGVSSARVRQVAREQAPRIADIRKRQAIVAECRAAYARALAFVAEVTR